MQNWAFFFFVCPKHTQKKLNQNKRTKNTRRHRHNLFYNLCVPFIFISTLSLLLIWMIDCRRLHVMPNTDCWQLTWFWWSRWWLERRSSRVWHQQIQHPHALTGSGHERERSYKVLKRLCMPVCILMRTNQCVCVYVCVVGDCTHVISVCPIDYYIFVASVVIHIFALLPQTVLAKQIRIND